jgi:uncharacterized protein (DUF488 family)
MGMQDFIALLERNKIAMLIDVRSHPNSRFAPQFNKGSIALSLKKAGIEYIWEGKYLGGLENTSIHAPEYISAMSRVAEHGSRFPTAIMCSEKDPSQCHRANKLSAWLHRNTDIEVIHIVRDELIHGRQYENNKGPVWLWPEFRGEKLEDDIQIAQAELFE